MNYHRVNNFKMVRAPTPFQRGIFISPTYTEFDDEMISNSTSTLQTGYPDLVTLGFPAAPGKLFHYYYKILILA